MIVVILIIGAFVRQAKRLHMNVYAWGAVAFVSYFIPQLLLGAIYAIYLDFQGQVFDNSSEMVANILGIAGAAIVSYWVYHKMPDWAAAKQTDNIDLLDDDDISDLK